MSTYTLNEKGTKECFPRDRKYQTLSSIPKESDDYSFFKFFIELDEQLFTLFSSNNNTYQNEELIKAILSTFERNKEQKNYLQYMVELLVYYIVIRPKQIEITCNLLSNILLNNENQRNIITQIIKDSHYFMFSEIESILYSKNIITKTSQEYHYHEKSLFNDYSYSSQKDNLELILRENDVNSLKEYIQRNKDISKNHSFSVSGLQYSQLKITHNQLNLLDYCSFYSSYECFQFLQANGFQYGNSINITSVAGGNLSIIHELEQKGISYDYCFETSVKYHQLLVTEWLLTNYKCEIVDLTIQIECYEYKSLLYMILNGYKFNEISIYHKFDAELTKYFIEKGSHFKKDYSLSKFCYNAETNPELIKYFIEHGADVNQIYQPLLSEYFCTPLLALCQHEKVNANLIHYFVEHGADVNKVSNIPKTIQITPLFSLCQKNEINFDLIKFLIENGADINKECIFKGIFNEIPKTPLLALCEQKVVNFDVIKYFIEHGADINKGNADGSPLFKLCQHDEVNIELIKYFIDSGADINKGYEWSSIIATPLYLLCKHKKLHEGLIKYFIEHGADVNIGNDDGIPLVALCARKEVNLELIKYFIEHGADVNKGDRTFPLFVACDRKVINIELIKYLLDHGADINKGCRKFFNPLRHFYNFDNYKSNDYNSDESDSDETDPDLYLSEFLIGDPRQVLTPLTALCRHEKVDNELVKYFIEHGADINRGEYITPLDALCKHAEVNNELIRYLIDCGADVNKLSPIYKLDPNNKVHKELIQYFIEHGAEYRRNY